MLILLTTRRKELQYDVFSTGNWEKVLYLGIIIAGASVLPLSVGSYLLASVLLVLGLAVALAGLQWHRSERTKKT